MSSAGKSLQHFIPELTGFLMVQKMTPHVSISTHLTCTQVQCGVLLIFPPFFPIMCLEGTIALGFFA